ncbi:uncharacterized protein OCT59_027825 [Rhizophagus irregularis]|uniref:Uncharacterized protein n=2 Tax=Rhizophagus irregularis TaxID=588596 RepID=A0A015J8R8_RHIIW|nr:hypothetical protein RirG_128300 [Rhizophagus irregularis DAOM 197198w]UZO07542.1 hypothetical protein OCT59_027825 [Rhizophagus irregularis]GBC15602.1 hypothetical protein RIR_jg13916.t1 [Rhizophagus irregularis DAOM 181602=DAOM 197198]CAG8616580.1 19476_t:CDS:1 [Rhizophagus irregularis]
MIDSSQIYIIGENFPNEAPKRRYELPERSTKCDEPIRSIKPTTCKLFWEITTQCLFIMSYQYISLQAQAQYSEASAYLSGVLDPIQATFRPNQGRKKFNLKDLY